MTTAMLAPGVYVQEESTGAHTIVGVPTSVAAFVGWTPRGPVDTATQVNNWSEYAATFGGFHPDSAVGYAVYMFFLNGGATAQVVRGDGATAAGSSVATFDVGGAFQLEAISAGAWANALTITTDTSNVRGDAFNLTVTDTATGRVELYQSVSLTGKNSLDAALRRSQLVRRAKPQPAPAVPPATPPIPPATPVNPGGAGGAPAGGPNPGGGAAGGGAAAAPVVATPGEKAVDAGVDAVQKNIEAAWNALAHVDIFNMLCLPTAPSARYAADTLSKAAAFCLLHRAVLIVDPPTTWVAPLQFPTVTQQPALTGAGDHAAIYFPNLVISDPDPKGLGQITCGPSGAIAGIWARTDATRGVWKAPAGTAAAFTGVRGLETSLIDSDVGTLNPLGVNCLKSIPFVGPVVWGARTMDGADDEASEWKYLPVRRTALFIEESLYRGTQWVVFEPNDEPLWSLLRLNIGAFMNSLFRQGAFQGSSPNEAYLVKCDAEINPQNDIDRGILNVMVGFAPLKPAEFILIHIEQRSPQLQT